jgi:ABC-type lipoprotein release transport system permease subunit
VHAAGYLDKPSLYKTMSNGDGVGGRLDEVNSVQSWTPRVYSPALAFAESRTSGAQIIGLDPLREAQTTTLPLKVSEGRFLPETPADEVVLGSGLAKILHVDVGDEVALITQAADGSTATGLFTIVGLMGKEGDSQERMTCYMPLPAAQQYLALEGRVHELVVVVSCQSEARSTAASIREALADPGLEVEPWQVVEREFYEAMQVDLKGNWVSLGIIMFIVVVGVLNTVLMTVFERTREFALLRAVGTRPWYVFRLIVLETAYLALISVVIGSALGYLGNAILSKWGIPVPEVEYGGVVWDRLLSSTHWRTIAIPAAVTLGSAIVVSMLPALRAVRMSPIEGLRHH